MDKYLYVRKNGEWKQANTIFIRKNGTWTRAVGTGANGIFIFSGGEWK